MGNFSSRDSRCRIDFFREGGKWHETEDFDMEEFYFGSPEAAARYGRGVKHYLLPEAIIAALRADTKFRRDDGSFRYAGCWAVVLKPYHEFAHPQLFRVPGTVRRGERAMTRNEFVKLLEEGGLRNGLEATALLAAFDEQAAEVEALRAELQDMADEKERQYARAQGAESLLAEAVGAIREQAWDWRNNASLPPDDETSRVLRMCADDLDSTLAKIEGTK